MLKRLSGLFIILFILVSGCSNGSREFETKNYIAMDTFFSITLPESHSDATDQLISLVSNLEKDFSIDQSTGDLWRINKQSGEQVTVNKTTIEWLSESIKYAGELNGFYDPSIEVVTQLWDFNNEIIPKRSNLESALKLVNYKDILIEGKNIVSIKEGMKIGAGATAKGFAVKKQRDLLLEENIHQGLITAGGNMFALGNNKEGEPWKIEIMHPRKDNSTIGFVLLENMSIDTSGDYEKFFEKDRKRYHHVLNPKTGYSDSDLISVTVICEDPVKADAFSTGLLAMGLEGAKEFASSHSAIEAILIDKSLKVFASEGLKDTFISTDGDEIYF